jgi:integrase
MLALYTGQRRGNVLRMRWDDIQDDGVHVKQQKRDKKVWVPIHPTLAEELKKLERKDLKIVGRRYGQPYTGSGFNSNWERQQAKHGFTGLQFHGLRRNAINSLLEAGCFIAEVAAITGQSFKMVAHYAQVVDQKRLASSAMNKLKTASGKPTGKLKVVGGTNAD